MNFLEHIFANLRQAASRPVLQEVREGCIFGVTGSELLEQVQWARSFLRAAGLRKGDRCALLAHNSIRWVAVDLALMADGVIVVPLYARQAAQELAAMARDAEPKLIGCGDRKLADALSAQLTDGPRCVLLDEVFAPDGGGGEAPVPLTDADPVTIIYTSGTSGEAKGVILNVGNLNHMLPCTMGRLDKLMGPRSEPDRVFHYLPFNFAGSWILLLTCLSRNTVLTLSTDLAKLADEMKLAAPHYFLNVPTLLERVRRSVEEQIAKRGGLAQALFEHGRQAWLREHEGRGGWRDRLLLELAHAAIFRAVRNKLGRELHALICGSAPLAVDTQLFFLMLGIPVLQVYGLTETTAICTLDHPHQVEPGRVGPAIPGTEMRLGENDEILVRGPHIFPGYWNRPKETAQVLRDGWFHTGDQGEVNSAGNWQIIGRIKNLIILRSGHNIAPEPIEDILLRRCDGAQQVVLVGNDRSYLAALIAGPVTHEKAEAAMGALNASLPHYKQIRAFHIHPEPLTIESGLLTANGKLRRQAIAVRFAAEIDALYRATSPTTHPGRGKLD